MDSGGRNRGGRASVWPQRGRAEVLNSILLRLCRQYPTLRRGGMTFDQIRRLLLSRAHRRGLELSVKVKPWPEAGMLCKIGNRLVINVDSRQSKSDQLWALAHEAGHVLFGHYDLEEEVWTLLPPKHGEDEWEREADFFAQFALRTPDTPPGWFLGNQLRLL